MNFTESGDTFLVGGPGGLPVTPAGGLTEQDWDNFAGKLEVDWRPNDDLLLYASFSRGHKAGGFNNGFVNGVDVGATNASVPYDEEIIHAYELGFKSEFFDGQARLNGAAFYYDYEDYQAFSFVGLGNSIVNADGNLYGGELEFVTNPVEGLEILLGAAYLESELENVLNAGGATFDGEFGLAPEFSANGIIRYEWPVFSGMMSAQTDFSYVGERFSSALNSPAYALDSYTVLNARASYTTEDERVNLSIFVKNLNDSREAVYKSELAAFGGLATQIYQPPRQVGASLTLRY